MGGQLIVPVRSDRPPFWLKNYAQNQLYLSSFHLSLRNAPAYAAALAAHGPTHMVSYPSSAATLAQLFLQHGLRVDGMIQEHYGKYIRDDGRRAVAGLRFHFESCRQRAENRNVCRNLFA